MPKRAFRYYQRSKIVNINANIIVAGLLAVALAKIPVHYSRHFIPDEQKLLITLFAIVCDMIADVAIYYALHWVANHWRPLGPVSKNESENGKSRSFVRDATVIQFQRMFLSPIYYGVAGGLMYLLKHQGMDRGWAFVIAFVTGIIVTRIIHTIWGVRTGQFKDA